MNNISNSAILSLPRTVNMENFQCKFLSLEFSHLKNTNHGRVDFLSRDQFLSHDEKSQSVFGVYGQNGSGKSTMILAFFILQKLFAGEGLGEETDLAIAKWAKDAFIKAELAIQNKDESFAVVYEAKFSKPTSQGFLLTDESLSAESFTDDKWRKYGCSFHVADNEDPTLAFGGDTTLKSVAKSLTFPIAKAIGNGHAKNCSVLFNDELLAALAEKKNGDVSKLLHILGLLHFFAISSFLVIDNHDRGLIDAAGILPLRIRHQDKLSGETGAIPLNLFQKNTVSPHVFSLVKEAIDQFNIVVPAFLPGLKIGIAVNANESTSGGNTVFELTSIINGYEIPLRSESDGTKRIISICNDLFACYNDDSVVLAIDEFDAGIFEYLFGEIIDVMDQGARGQMIFTSHNLRPLEVLSPAGLILTTTDPDDRYDFFKGIRATNNARDMYLRNAFLSQSEDHFYKPTNEYEIAKAFMKIGSLYHA